MIYLPGIMRYIAMLVSPSCSINSFFLLLGMHLDILTLKANGT